jgi:hypothetical protein
MRRALDSNLNYDLFGGAVNRKNVFNCFYFTQQDPTLKNWKKN